MGGLKGILQHSYWLFEAHAALRNDNPRGLEGIHVSFIGIQLRNGECYSKASVLGSETQTKRRVGAIVRSLCGLAIGWDMRVLVTRRRGDEERMETHARSMSGGGERQR